MLEVNEEKKLARKTPSESAVSNRVAQAKQTPRVISH
jgi:hypothetical protein